MYRGHNAWNTTRSGIVNIAVGCTNQNECVGVMLLSENRLEGHPHWQGCQTVSKVLSSSSSALSSQGILVSSFKAISLADTVIPDIAA